MIGWKMNTIKNRDRWFLRLNNGRILPKSGRFQSRAIKRCEYGYDFDPAATCPVWRAYLGQFENLRIESLQKYFQNCAVPRRRHSRLLVVVSQHGRPRIQLGLSPAEYLLTNLLQSMFVNLSPQGKSVSSWTESSSLQSNSVKPIAVLYQMPSTRSYARLLAERLYQSPSRAILFTRRSPVKRLMPVHDVADFRTQSNVYHVELRELIEERSGILNWALETLREKKLSQPDHWLPRA